MTPIPTPAGNILAIPVPREAGMFHIRNYFPDHNDWKVGYIKDGKPVYIDSVIKTNNPEIIPFNDVVGGKSRANNPSIIGTVTNGEPPAFDFDCSKYIYEGEPGCKHTDSNCLCSRIDDYPEAFLSLLSAHGHYHKNPHSKPDRSQYITNSPDDEENRRMQDEYNQDLQTWQEAEAKIFEKLVIIKEK